MTEAFILLGRNCGPGVIHGSLLDELGSVEWLKAQFGVDYQSRYFNSSFVSTKVERSRIPPAVNMPIAFKPFEIEEDWEGQFNVRGFMYLPCEAEDAYHTMVNMEEIYQLWYDPECNWDFDLMLRYIPLFQLGGPVPRFDPKHLGQLFGFVMENRSFARLLRAPTGPLADEL